jgi:hypothetical protein
MQMTNRVSAVFDNHAQAEQAVLALRQMGVRDEQLSIVSRHEGDLQASGGGGVATEHHSNRGDNVGRGALTGATVGALFGLAALAIPGVGPFITAGFLAEALGVAGGAAAAGAIVGGTSGAVAGAFSKAGYSEEEARYYGGAVEQGGVFVAVNTMGGAISDAQVRDVLTRHGGRVYGSTM